MLEGPEPRNENGDDWLHPRNRSQALDWKGVLLSVILAVTATCLIVLLGFANLDTKESADGRSAQSGAATKATKP